MSRCVVKCVLPAVIALNVGRRVVGRVVDAISDAITLTPTQLRPVSEFDSTIQSNHLPAIGSGDDRMFIWVDIEKLMSGADSGLVEQNLQQAESRRRASSGRQS